MKVFASTLFSWSAVDGTYVHCHALIGMTAMSYVSVVDDQAMNLFSTRASGKKRNSHSTFFVACQFVHNTCMQNPSLYMLSRCKCFWHKQNNPLLAHNIEICTCSYTCTTNIFGCEANDDLSKHPPVANVYDVNHGKCGTGMFYKEME